MEDGFSFVSPRGTKVAQTLLSINEELGHPVEDVRARTNGYEVHDDVAAKYAEQIASEEPAAPTDEEKAADADAQAKRDALKKEQDDSTAAAVAKEAEDAANEKARQDAADAEANEQAKKDAVDAAEKAGTTVPPVGENSAPISADQENASQEAAVEYPAGNASRDVWFAFASTRPGFNEEADSELSYSDLKAKYGKPAAE